MILFLLPSFGATETCDSPVPGPRPVYHMPVESIVYSKQKLLSDLPLEFAKDVYDYAELN